MPLNILKILPTRSILIRLPNCHSKTVTLAVTTAEPIESTTRVLLIEDDDEDYELIQLLLDDFGTGYSSLANLIRYPIRALKVDASFVKDIGLDLQSETIIKATIGLTKSLGLDLIAEGVETRSQAEILLENGCRIMQGWLYNRAANAQSVVESLLEFRKTAPPVTFSMASAKERFPITSQPIAAVRAGRMK